MSLHQRLGNAIGSGKTDSSTSPSVEAHENVVGTKNVVTYQWSQFHGKWQTTEFDLDSHLSMEGHFESNSSAGHKEYQDRLRTIHFHQEGKAKSEIAKILGRSEKFVSKWWQKSVKEVPRPHGVHAYLAHDDNGGLFAQGAVKTENSAMDAATHWRDIELRRGFAKDPAIYSELLQNTDWKGADVSRTRDFATGARHLKYDKEGNVRMQGSQRGKHVLGKSPALDRALQKVMSEYGIEDRTTGVLLNWYPDGGSMLGSHRHDCWTALLSFGSNRILTIDNTPVLCSDGDLIIFGTQRHGVPLMPEISDGRITIPIFFYPDAAQKKTMWQTIADDGVSEPTHKLARLQNETNLAGSAIDAGTWASHANELAQMCDLGFEEELAKQALLLHRFNVERAASALLSASEVAMPASGAAHDFGLVSTEYSVSSGLGRWRKQRLPSEQGTHSIMSLGSVTASLLEQGKDSRCLEANTAEDDTEISQSLALALQLTECVNPRAPLADSDADAESLSIAMALKLQEEDESRSFNPDVLREQFAQYEETIDRLDAEDRWNGLSGDLMGFASAREHLQLETMDTVTPYSLGHGTLTEKSFFEILQLNSIRVLYDTRPIDYRQELMGVPERFSVRTLKAACKARGIFYKQMSVGRESAYGTLAHLKSVEGRHILIEIAWQAKRKRTAFLGRELQWKDDHRRALADALCAAGHKVEHISSDGICESHISQLPLPHWLSEEEARFRKIEKQRQNGELSRPEKSSVDRSTESVASRLTRRTEAIDAMVTLGEAENQTQLKFAQQKLVRLQRSAEQKELPTKKLANTPQFIKDEARAQAEWVAQRKKEKGKAAETKPSSSVSSTATSSTETTCSSSALPDVPNDAEVVEIFVECSSCCKILSWSQLAEHDGVCSPCAEEAQQHPGTALSETNSLDCTGECLTCQVACSWSLLSLGDGICPGCFQAARSRSDIFLDDDVADPAHPAQVETNVGTQEPRNWRARRRHASSSAA